MMAGMEQSAFDFGQKANAFFRSDATDKAQAKQPVVCRAEVRMKFLAINAARNEKRRPAGPFLEPTHLLSSGRESDARDAIKTQEQAQRSSFRPIVGGLRERARHEAEEFFEAPAGILVKVGVPGRRQGNAERVREEGAQLAEVAGTGDVDHLGPELRERAAQEFQVPPEKEVVAKVALDAEAGKAAGKFDRGDAAFVQTGQFGSGTDAQKGKVLAPGVSHQLAGGERNAIDFVKGFTKQGDARGCLHKPLSSVPRKARRRAGRI